MVNKMFGTNIKVVLRDQPINDAGAVKAKEVNEGEGDE